MSNPGRCQGAGRAGGSEAPLRREMTTHPLEPWEPRLLAAWRQLRSGGGAGRGGGGRGGAGGAGGGEGGGVAPLSAAERRDVVEGAQRLSRGLTRERELA